MTFGESQNQVQFDQKNDCGAVLGRTKVVGSCGEVNSIMENRPLLNRI
jgi:hypothetical protein